MLAYLWQVSFRGFVDALNPLERLLFGAGSELVGMPVDGICELEGVGLFAVGAHHHHPAGDGGHLAGVALVGLALPLLGTRHDLGGEVEQRAVPQRHPVARVLRVL